MVDSGASTLFINKRFVAENKVRTRKLREPIRVYNIDGTENKAGAITEVAVLNMQLGEGHVSREVFTVTDIGPEDVMIGIDWLRYHNPEINWYEGEMKMSRCPDSCQAKEPTKATKPASKGDTGDRPTAHRRKEKKPKKEPRRKQQVPMDVDEEDPEPEPMVIDGTRLEKGDRLFVLAGYTYSSEIAAQEAQQKLAKTLEEMVPEQYRDFMKLFSKEASDRLPEHGPFDHVIELVPGAKGFHSKTYPIAKSEQAALDAMLKEQLEKGYIRPSKSPITSPFFFIKKKDGNLRPVQDYRRLNEITIKDRYPLPLISELMDRLSEARIFTKLDVRWGYNNIRIREGDEYKAAFVTNRGVFEPTVMTFGLTNAPATFQSMMDYVFADLVSQGKVTIYLDDILIYTKDLDEHRKVVREVLRRLVEKDLYLKPEKCEFEVEETEYLGVIVGHGQIRMDPAKVQAIVDWQVPTSPTEVRQFRGFANFYRRFIKDFGKLCKPLDKLTGKAPWNWGDEQQEAFEELKRRFASHPVLRQWDFSRPTRVETDASGYACGATLEQWQDEDNAWHPIAFLSEGMTETERNYDIYDRELMAIVRALEHWRHYLIGLDEFEIYSDHKNLEYWKTAKNLTRRQARWSLFLAEFHFKIVPKSGKTMGKPDAMSRQKQHQVSDAEDNVGQVVLKPEHFRLNAARRGHAQVVPDKALLKRIRECETKDAEVVKALEQVKQLGPKLLSRGLEEWNVENDLLLFRGKVYVPHDNTLRKDLVQLHHDAPPAGHPGRAKTLELLSRNYWWPGMTKFVNEYVDTCDICQRTKSFPAKPRGPLQPLEVPEAPFKSIATDQIVKLPTSEGCDAITTTVDRFTGIVHFSPTTEALRAEEHAQLYIRDVFRLHGAPEKVLSDRGPAYASKLLQAIYKGIGIKPTLSTAYHPQTDGKTERMNAEIEQYLRAFCAYRQDDWVQWLPIAEFALNARISSATGKSPFELLYGYQPEFRVSENPMTNVPAADERLKLLKEAQEDARSALELTAERMKRFYDHGVQAAPQFKIGDKVYVEREKHPRGQPTSKLAPRRDGPYPIVRKLGELVYEVKLTPRDKRHPVFHVDRLRPTKTATRVPDRELPEPPPIVVDEEEEYEVEEILDSAIRNGKFKYYVKWKGYSDAECSWEPEENVKNAPDLVRKFHRKNPGAPRPIAASLFVAMNFRPINEHFDPPPKETLGRTKDWEYGRYLRPIRRNGP